MKISVVIPTYNRIELTKRAIQSVLDQSYKADEIIIVNDGGKSIASIKKEYPSLIYCDIASNRGVSYARNIGITKSKNKWIAFLDSDDIWLQDKLKLQVQYHQTHKNIKISQTQEIWIKDGIFTNQPKFNKKHSGWIFPKLIHRCTITASSVLINKQVFEDIGVFDENLRVCEDYDMWLRISKIYKIGLIDTPLIKKYLSSNSCDHLSLSTWGMDRYRIEALKKHLNDNKYKYEIQELLIKKYNILIKGANKRGNIKIKNRYTKELESVDKY